ncbi:MAG TPA: glutamate--ammonia ligase [Steroidobacteraceae bacterium]|nr:glutamate--ammonia ligase [Steroidobacteraceae bacterium]
MTPSELAKFVKEKQLRYADLRFTDTRGKEQHVSIPARYITEEFFVEGKMFDGSSIAGWKGINESDMILMPDASTAVVDPFFEEPTINIRCDIVEPATMQGYERDPRSLAKRAEAYLKSTGIADSALFGPENEFFIFDDVRWDAQMRGCFYEIDSVQGAWNSGSDIESGNKGHRPGIKGGYFPVPPVDAYQDIRAAMCKACEDMGLVVEVHHHEVATGGQCELGIGANTLTKKADEVQILKYALLNVGAQYGKSVTFMPKPLVGDNGSGMHVHQSLSKGGKNIMAGDKYAGLSDECLYYIGGIIKHAKAINAFTNASTNSYKRLVPGFEAPVMLAYSARNRSASIRVPWVSSAKARRIEVRFPDSTANPYFAFSAMMMAGLDGIQNKIHPGDPADKDLYDLEPEEAKHIPTVCHSLDMALENLDKDREFLTRGGVFTNDLIDAYIALKMQEVTRLRMTTHPVELDMYYSC